MEVIKRELFIYPTKEEAKSINKQYQKELDKVKSNLDLISKELKPSTETKGFDDIIFEEILDYQYENFYNKILLSNYYMHNVLCLSRRPLSKFEGGVSTANTILYETDYEMFYIQLANIRERFYQLVKHCFCLKESMLIKSKFINELNQKEHGLGDRFDMICRSNGKENSNPLITDALTIRNSFTHGRSPFEGDCYYKQSGDSISKFVNEFNYQEKAELVLSHFIEFLKFINEQAVPFLMKSPYLKGNR